MRSVPVEEIERVIDDLETKRNLALENYREFNDDVVISGMSLIEVGCYQYAIQRLRELL